MEELLTINNNHYSFDTLIKVGYAGPSFNLKVDDIKICGIDIKTDLNVIREDMRACNQYMEGNILVYKLNGSYVLIRGLNKLLDQISNGVDEVKVFLISRPMLKKAVV